MTARDGTRRLIASRPEDLDEAADLLRQGALVAFPTETVYGLGADGTNAEAIAGIFRAKGRPGDNPLILHVATFEQALDVWETHEEQRALARLMAEAFWPGPLTIVLPAAKAVPEIVRAGLPTVAVRLPDHSVAQDLLQRCQRPLAAPSANRSGRPSPTTAEHVLRTLDGRIHAVIDGGPTTIGVESTVLDLTREQPTVLRPGDISAAMIDEALRPVRIQVARTPVPEDAASPGVRHRHYAPIAMQVAIVDDDTIQQAWASSDAILCRQSMLQRWGPREGPLEALSDAADGFAQQLYAALYRLEQSGAQRLLIARVPDGHRWGAIGDRLERAAGKS